MDAEVAGRSNQRRRTRKALLDAATRLVRQGRKPSLDRYFPNAEALLVEASFDIAIPEPRDLFQNDRAVDPVARVQQVDTALHDMILANEVSLRMMLVHSLGHALSESEKGGLPLRQNRRMPLIEAALKPARHQFSAGALDTLSKALALVIGTEGVIVAKDVLQLDDAEARKVKRWAIRALVEAAMKRPRP
jgi:hypothetical protein